MTLLIFIEKMTNKKEARTANSTYKKLAVQWLNEALCFASSSVLAGSFRLRNRQLLVAANRYVQGLGDLGKFNNLMEETNRQKQTTNYA